MLCDAGYMSVREWAERAGVGRNNLLAYCAGRLRYLPTPRVACALAKVLRGAGLDVWAGDIYDAVQRTNEVMAARRAGKPIPP